MFLTPYLVRKDGRIIKCCPFSNTYTAEVAPTADALPQAKGLMYHTINSTLTHSRALSWAKSIKQSGAWLDDVIVTVSMIRVLGH